MIEAEEKPNGFSSAFVEKIESCYYFYLWFHQEKRMRI